MWQEYLLAFAEQFHHPAWGTAHARRVYEMTLQLGREKGVTLDEDALFGAAFLHDMGAFSPYRQAGVDHADRSTQTAPAVLEAADFPANRITAVQEIIQGHMFYATPSTALESILFHDADTLDFMGAMGVTRILSIVGLDDWTPDLLSAVNLIRRFCQELPDRLYSEEAKVRGAARQKEMARFLSELGQQSENFKIL
jgi:uncharacterized protein